MTAPGLYEAATDARRHYTRDLLQATTPTGWVYPGRHGYALCDPATVVLDDDRRAYVARIDGQRPPRPVADLPLCKRCQRKAAKLGLTTVGAA